MTDAINAAAAILTVDLRAIAHNWRLLSARAAPARCGAVVKADAYGLGAEQVVRPWAGDRHRGLHPRSLCHRPGAGLAAVSHRRGGRIFL